MARAAARTTRPEASPQLLDVSRFRPAERRRLSASGLRTFLAIADRWGLNEEQRCLVLGMPSRSTYHGWAKTARENGELTLSVDVLLRISAVLGIWQALQILYPSEQDAVAWLRRPNSATVFGGAPPLALITAGTQDALMMVRRFLDAARGGIYMAPNQADAGFVPYADTDLVFS